MIGLYLRKSKIYPLRLRSWCSAFHSFVPVNRCVQQFWLVTMVIYFDHFLIWSINYGTCFNLIFDSYKTFFDPHSPHTLSTITLKARIQFSPLQKHQKEQYR